MSHTAWDKCLSIENNRYNQDLDGFQVKTTGFAVLTSVSINQDIRLSLQPRPLMFQDVTRTTKY